MKEEVFTLHSELESVHWWFVSRRKILLPLIHRVMSDNPQDLIVDVGCGTGGTVANFHSDFNCIGIDPSESAIEKARSAYPSCQFICGHAPSDLDDIKDRTALYLLMDVLEHIEDDKKFLADLVAHARPGSHFLITVPAHMALWSQHDETALHVRRYEYDPFQLLWSGLPVQPLLVSFFNARLYPAIWASTRLTITSAVASGIGRRIKLALVITPIVPRLPVSSRQMSYPATFLTTFPPALSRLPPEST